MRSTEQTFFSLIFACISFGVTLPNCCPLSVLIELSSAAPRCLPVGYDIGHWADLVGASFKPANRECSVVSFHSPSLYIYAAGRLAIKHRTCLYQQYHNVNFEMVLHCDGRTVGGQRTLRLVHPALSIERAKQLTEGMRKRSAGTSPAVIRFEQAEYVVNVTEERPAGEPVASVHAEHADGLPLYYSMVAPEDARSASLYNLDTRSGVITTNAALDREAIDRHVLKVTASERGNPLHSTSVIVTVNVDDAQDHSPQFERTAYFATVNEDSPLGKTVLRVYASDDDAGVNGRVRYSLTNQQPSTNPTHFSINPNTGFIQVAVNLDREEVAAYELLVTATDGNVQDPRSAQVLVKIDVKDVNDNYPQVIG